MFDKEIIFNEFEVARQKDLSASNENDICYDNRIAYLKSHRDAKKSNPKVYRNLDINFDNLINMYASGNPDEYNYKKLGILPYHIKQMIEEAAEKDETYNDERNNVKEVTFN